MKSKRAREAAEVDEKLAAQPAANEDGPAKKRKRNDDDVNDGEANGVDNKKSKKDKSEKKNGKKKDKKDKKESRKEKKDKRRDLQDLPEGENEDEEQQVDKEVAETEKTEKKSAATEAKTEDEEAKKKEKKERKKAKKDKKKEKEQQNGDDKTAATTNGDEPDKTPIDLDASTASTKTDRHIVFVGNLPYSATATSISAHFASLSPIAVRCLRNKNDPNPCRGIAFVEFGKVWHMRTCLDKFHHSTFDDGVSPPRKINVELTAGGGGKTEQRQQKIREKNQKLDENRNKRIEREKDAKTEGKTQQQIGEDSIHPSRRGRVPGMGY